MISNHEQGFPKMARPDFCLVFHQTTQRARGMAALGQDSTGASQHLAGSELAVDKTQGQELPGEVLTLGMPPILQRHLYLF